MHYTLKDVLIAARTNAQPLTTTLPAPYRKSEGHDAFSQMVVPMPGDRFYEVRKVRSNGAWTSYAVSGIYWTRNKKGFYCRVSPVPLAKKNIQAPTQRGRR